MPKEPRQQKIAENTSGGGHVSGSSFGQKQDAKTKDTKKGGNKARPNSPKAKTPSTKSVSCTDPQK